MAGMAIIQAHGLTKNYGSVRAVADLSFSVERGSVTGFLGPNGAGKTTTLRMLLGLVRADAGTATINGRAYAGLPEPLHQVGAVLEASSFHPGRTARNHLRIQALAAAADPARIEEVLGLVELRRAAGQRIGGFSLGMRQRLGLATALLADPEILILDEPANGLDPEGVRWLRDFLRAFASGGRTVLVSSHVLAEVAQTVDQVLIVTRGRLVVESPLAQLTSRIGGTVRVRTPQPDQLEQALRRDGLDAARDDQTLVVRGADTDRVGEIAFAAGVPVYELLTEGTSLEEIFLQLTAEPSAEPRS
jgi:ABC-2 type transport system ATP-binding protein